MRFVIVKDNKIVGIIDAQTAERVPEPEAGQQYIEADESANGSWVFDPATGTVSPPPQ
jgi:hypothetical protein